MPKKIAVFFDCENVSSHFVEFVFKKLRKKLQIHAQWLALHFRCSELSQGTFCDVTQGLWADKLGQGLCDVSK